MMRKLRKMLVCPRRLESDGHVGETWVEWIVRVAHRVENVMEALGIRGWVETQRLRKQQLANRIEDNQWAKRLLIWQPAGGLRRVGRPFARW